MEAWGMEGVAEYSWLGFSNWLNLWSLDSVEGQELILTPLFSLDASSRVES